MKSNLGKQNADLGIFVGNMLYIKCYNIINYY